MFCPPPGSLLREFRQSPEQRLVHEESRGQKPGFISPPEKCCWGFQLGADVRTAVVISPRAW